MEPAAPHSISAVLPAFNESGVIVDVVRRTAAALERSGVERYEVVVVDDGSTDRTGDLVRRLADELKGVRCVAHEHNRGYGAALRTGFEAASCDLVWLLDSDGQFDPADLHVLLDAWEPGTLVAGYRIARRDSALRRLYHWAFFRLVRVLLGPTVRDVNCAFKLFPRVAGVGLTSDGAMISTELLARARDDGLRFVEVGVEHHPRVAGHATGADPRVVLRAFAELARLRRRLRSTPEGARSGS